MMKLSPQAILHMLSHDRRLITSSFLRMWLFGSLCAYVVIGLSYIFYRFTKEVMT